MHRYQLNLQNVTKMINGLLINSRWIFGRDYSSKIHELLISFCFIGRKPDELHYGIEEAIAIRHRSDPKSPVNNCGEGGEAERIEECLKHENGGHFFYWRCMVQRKSEINWHQNLRFFYYFIFYFFLFLHYINGYL